MHVFESLFESRVFRCGGKRRQPPGNSVTNNRLELWAVGLRNLWARGLASLGPGRFEPPAGVPSHNWRWNAE
jgi:hypothetical protein